MDTFFATGCRYQTGVLAPVIRRLSRRMQRAAALPQPPRAAVRGNNLPAAGAQGNENGGIAGKDSLVLIKISCAFNFTTHMKFI